MIDSLIKKLPDTVNWFDILSTEGTSTSISFKNNRLHSLNEKQNSGSGIRINVDNRTGFSYTNDSSNMDGIIERALAMASYGDREGFLLPGPAPAAFEPFDDKISLFDTANEIEKGSSVIAAILARYPRANIDVSMGASQGLTRIVNSSGFNATYRNSFYSLSVSITVIQDDGTKIDVWDSISSLSPRDCDEIPGRLLERIRLAENTRSAESGKIPVILTPRAFSRLLGIVASGLDARSVYRGISPFGGKTGEKLFNEGFTLTDDPTITDSPYSYPFDDEGVPGLRKDLIRSGIIENFVTDLKHAEKLGLIPGGNASRGYASLPSPSFSSIIIGGGTASMESMLRNMGRGLLVEQFIGLGQSNTLTGDFSGNLDLAYLVENGEITGRVKDCMLADNIFSLLGGELVLSSEREQTGSVLSPFAFFPAVNYTR